VLVTRGFEDWARLVISFFIAFMTSFFFHLSFLSFSFSSREHLADDASFHQEFKNFLKQHEPVIVDN
jgi:hypothetical protein